MVLFRLPGQKAKDVEGTCGVVKACLESHGCGFEGCEGMDVVCGRQALHLERV